MLFRSEPFGLLSIDSTPAEQLAEAATRSRWLKARATAGRGTAAFRHEPARERQGAGGRLRIGYLSADFYEHASAHCLVEVFELHDRERFETIGYSCGPDDRSAVRARLERAFSRFADLRLASNEEAAARIHADGVDVLVDLKGYTAEARTEIVALRPAPVQASYLGYPATMGADFIDYLITDRFVVPPESLAFYSERPAYLEGCYYPSDRGRPVSEAPARAALGLPEEGLVFCCFNQPYKILPRVFETWMRILAATPGAVLWLLQTNPWAPENLREEARRQGLDPARLVFAPACSPSEYLRRLRAADLFLDTVPCNAHTTASDALWVGLPVLTCTGETFASRVAASQLRALELPELITGSLAEYEALALRLAAERGLLGGLREKLWGKRTTGRLFDTPALVRSLEAAYEQMWAIYAAGDPPRPIGL